MQATNTMFTLEKMRCPAVPPLACHGHLTVVGKKRRERVEQAKPVKTMTSNRVADALAAARQMVSVLPHDADTKAFTGKGKLLQLRQLLQQLDEVEIKMNELMEVTHQVPGRTMFLTIYRRAQTTEVKLRWRRTLAYNNKFLSHQEARNILDAENYAESASSWYQRVINQAIEFNTQHASLRKQIKDCRDQIVSQPQHTFTRLISSMS